VSRGWGGLIALLLAAAPALAQQPEYPIDIPGLDRKPYSLGGFVEVRPVALWLDPDAALYGLRFFEQEKTTRQYNAQLQLDAGYRKGMASLFTRTVFDARQSRDGWDRGVTSYEAYVSLKPSPSFTLDAGKKTLKWGKGYIWNPAAFLDRPKDPDDPALALEGLIVVSADYIKSFDGPLRTLSISPVIVPVYEDVNETFGRRGRVNVAGRLYLLLYDTDVDVMILAGGSRPRRMGLDVSRNLRSNLEVHGEYALVPDAHQVVVDENGRLIERTGRALSWLAGLRYLMASNTTFIVDLYRNGLGFTEEEMGAYFDLARAAPQAMIDRQDDRLLALARRAAEAGYTGTAPTRDYLYARVSQPDALDILYFNLAVAGIVNLADGSASVVPELTYKAFANLELRAQLGVLLGGRGTEFGEKQANVRLDVRARYYF
jgi:hypothetical protein